MAAPLFRASCQYIGSRVAFSQNQCNWYWSSQGFLIHPVTVDYFDKHLLNRDPTTCQEHITLQESLHHPSAWLAAFIPCSILLSAQSNVCFGNQITTYTVIHKYLHFIIVSASQSSQGWDSTPYKGDKLHHFNWFPSCCLWALVTFPLSELFTNDVQGKKHLFFPLLVFLLGAVWERQPSPKGKNGRDKAMVHFKIEVLFHSDFCSSFLVAFKRV